VCENPERQYPKFPGGIIQNIDYYELMIFLDQQDNIDSNDEQIYNEYLLRFICEWLDLLLHKYICISSY